MKNYTYLKNKIVQIKGDDRYYKVLKRIPINNYTVKCKLLRLPSENPDLDTIIVSKEDIILQEPISIEVGRKRFKAINGTLNLIGEVYLSGEKLKNITSNTKLLDIRERFTKSKMLLEVRNITKFSISDSYIVEVKPLYVEVHPSLSLLGKINFPYFEEH